MKNIYKYELPLSPGAHKLELPRGAKILSAGTSPIDPNTPCLWALVNTLSLETDTWDIALAFTGDALAEPPFGREWIHLDSFVCLDDLVYHAFVAGIAP